MFEALSKQFSPTTTLTVPAHTSAHGIWEVVPTEMDDLKTPTMLDF